MTENTVNKTENIITGADIIIECLLEQGVDTVFGYPGGAVLNIYDSLYKYSDRITHYLASHEQHAGHAADGYARASGKTGVVIATSGPGASNLMTAIATAQMDSIPVVVITGNVNLDLLGLDSFQEVDITGMTMPVTKHNFVVRDAANLADTIRKAFFIANDGRPGVVLVDVPKDITSATREFTRKAVPMEGIDMRSKRASISEEQISAAVKLMINAKRPYIYTGGGVISAGASEAAAQLAEILNAPVSSSLMGHGSFDQSEDRYIGMLGMHGSKASAETIKNCDLFIALGTRFSDRVTGDTSTFAKDTKIIHVDIDAVEHSKNVDAYVEVVGDLKEVLHRFTSSLIDNAEFKQIGDSWVNRASSLKEKYALRQQGTDVRPVTPQQVLETLCEITGGDAVITTEVGQNQMWAAMYYTYKNPRSFITSGGLGTMGFGLGAAIGAKIAVPDKIVINVAGDGSFGMNLNELSTISKYKIPVIQLVLNNGTLGMVRQWQKLFYDKRYSQTTIGKTFDYEKLADAFGIESFIIEKQEDLRSSLKGAVKLAKAGVPSLIECRIDIDLNVLPMVPAGKSIVEPLLEINGEK